MANEENYALPSEERFQRLINRDSNDPQWIHGEHYLPSEPVPVTGGINASNTRVVLNNLRVTQLFPTEVLYKRIPAARILHRLGYFGVEYIEPPPLPFTTADVVALINDLGVLALQPHEYLNETFTDPVEELTLTILNASLAWLPGTITIPLIAENARFTEDGDTRVTEDGEVRLVE